PPPLDCHPCTLYLYTYLNLSEFSVPHCRWLSHRIGSLIYSLSHSYTAGSLPYNCRYHHTHISRTYPYYFCGFSRIIRANAAAELWLCLCGCANPPHRPSHYRQSRLGGLSNCLFLAHLWAL